ncbi:MAG: carnitine 3-dehydrogenase [Pseudomonadota bacterium]
MTSEFAIIGGGVIGAGWSARLRVMGRDVRIFDPAPGAEARAEAALAKAQAAWEALTLAPLPAPGALQVTGDLAGAVAGAAWIFEAVPERLEVKQAVYAQIEAANPDGVIASATSGFKPSVLQAGMARPERLIVAHPFVPVYLIPLVELVAGAATDPAVMTRAAELVESLGMHPLALRKEIDAFIADRFLEAVWREALWLVKDGIATTGEIDDAIRMSFGLRWAQMGLFEGYRIAGGAGGMRHFLAQFGPALAWPWTKLMDVPELSEALVETIAAQSDAQSGALTIDALEDLRDGNLVAILQGLKARQAGAGAVIAAHERRLVDAAGGDGAAGEDGAGGAGAAADPGQPVETLRRQVPAGWTDYNGHMNEARYLQAFCDATDALMRRIGCDADYIAAGSSYFTAETHIQHLAEAVAGEEISVTTQLLAGSGKKLRLFHRMWRGETLLATGEHMLIHVDLESRRSSLPGPAVAERLAVLAAAHAGLAAPDGAGRGVGAPR